MMAKYRLNDSFKRFPGHYLYVITLVSTGLFFGRVTTTNVKAATPEDATPTTDTTETIDQSATSTILRTISNVPENSTTQRTVGIETSAPIATDSPTAEVSQSQGSTTEISQVTPDSPTSEINDPGEPNSTGTADNSGSSTSTSTASLTVTPANGIIPLNSDSQTAVPKTDQIGASMGTAASSSATAETPTTITADPQNATIIAPDALGVKPVGSIKLNVPVPTDGKDAIKATNNYYYTIDGNINIYNQLANYHGSLKDASEGAWQGSAFAANIPTNANGIDPTTGAYYIDEWMPDIWFQYLLWSTKYTTQYRSWAAFKNMFSKSSLSNLTDFTVTEASQQTSSTNLTPTLTYTALVQTQSLEGLQYAQNLNTINFTVNSDVSEQEYDGDIQSHLWDISALGKIPSLRSVRFIATSIQDISALRANPNLQNIELSFNQISDISGFNNKWTQPNPTDPNNSIGSSRYNGISLPLLVLNPGTTSVEVTYNVKGADGSLSHMIPSDGFDFDLEVAGQFKASTADAVSEDNHTIVFYNLLTPPAGNVGWLSAAHTFYMDGNDGSAFDVWVSIPYIISDDYGMTNVNYENLLPNGQQEEVATSTPLSGPVNETYNILTDPNTTYPLEWLLDKYGSNYLVLDGTGNYSDYVANNGLAKEVPVTGTYATDPQNLTVLFAPTSPLAIQRGYYDSNHTFVPLTLETTVDQSTITNLSLKDQATSISNFHYTSAEIVATDGTTTVLPDTTTDVPYLVNGLQLRLVYAPDAATINFTYKDNLGTTLSQSGSVTGTTLSTISPESNIGQIEIPDYTFDHYETHDGTPITTPMTYADLQAGLTLVYKGNTLPINLNYIDNLGNEIHPSVPLSGVVNAALPNNFISDNQINIPDYTFDHVELTNHQPFPSDATFNTIRDGLTYVYAPNSIAIPIHYRDSSNHKIAEDGNLNSPINTNVTPEQISDVEIAIKNYTFKEIQDSTGNPITFPMSTEKIRGGIILIYNENKVSIPITYVDSDGKMLLSSNLIEGLATHQLTAAQITTITGYTLNNLHDQDGNQITLPTTFGELVGRQLQAVYEPIQVAVPVQIVDAHGNVIGNSLPITGNYLDQLTEDQIRVLAPSVNGYLYSNTQDSAGQALTLPILLGEIDPAGIKLVYSENDVVISVKYLDPDGNELSPAVAIDDKFTGTLSRESLELPAITGYTIDQITDGTGNPIVFPTTFGAIRGSIQVTYQPIQVTVPVQIINTNGVVIGNSAPITGNYLDQLTEEQIRAMAPSINGYLYSNTQDSTGNALILPIQLGDIEPAGIKLIYSENDVVIPVKYMGPDGSELSQTVSITGKFTETLTRNQLQIPNITGYAINSITDDTGETITLPTTFGAIKGYIQVVYEPVQITIPVQYVDDENNTIANPIQISGNYLDQLTTDKIAELVTPINGYTYVEAQDATDKPLSLPVTLGTITNGIKLVYSANEVPTNVTVTIHYVDPNGHQIQPPTTIHGNSSDSLTSEQISIPNLPGYVFDHFEDNAGNPLSLPITYGEINDSGLHVIYQPIKVTVPVYYLDNNGKTIAHAQQIPGNYQDPFTAVNLTGLQQAIPGYQFSNVRTASGETLALPTILGELQTGLYLIYTVDNTNVVPPETPDTTPPDGNPGDIIPEKVPAKVIYAMKEISLHTTANFTSDNIIMTYVKKPRIYRPRFMVIDTVRDSQNRLRYLVRDINSKSDTYGLIGYITADPEYVRSAYYHIVPATITVINPKGINGYANNDLTGKLAHYGQGTVLKVASILKDKTATRFILTNGQIVTASKILVKMGTIPQPKRATKLKALNRYGDLDLTIKLEHFKKVTPKSFGILSWDYSDGYNYHVKSLKRYKIDNGYITAYSKLVKSDY